MSIPHIERPDLPEYMTWEELERLPEEIAEQIELWDGRVVWVRRGPSEHQVYTANLFNALRRAARKSMSECPEQCWQVALETNVFLGKSGKSNFLTPDFLVFRCIEEYKDVRATDTLLVGEVHSPSNTQTDIEAKKFRYASAGIPWYWEVALARNPRGIASIRAYVLETGHGRIPQGVRPLRTANYIVAGEWTPQDNENGVEIDFPFPISIPWSDLDY
ncbi:Uma2 family endonuclease [Nocardia sp. NPDC052566]|uniref:Uma2 family endonuclease n=1 Tax=Nocardia sp. NPDC052566 TaxID=3364330 RepID=UPI0037C5549D